jgi:hypothetical protein
MNINDLTHEDRVNLIIIFRQFRADDTEDDEGGYANRDLIERKLRDGEGELDEHERHMLAIAVCSDGEADHRMRDHFCTALGQEQRGMMVEGERND